MNNSMQAVNGQAKGPVIRVGRGVDCDVIVDDRYVNVSRYHAMIFREGSLLVLADNSTNGTYINNQRVQHSRQYIRPGDKILLGGNYPLHWSEIQKFFPDMGCATRFSEVPPVQGPQRPAESLSSASTSASSKPVSGWNWGAFYFGWLWGVFNGVYWPLIELIPIVGQLASLVVRIILGINGNRWAWENKVWTNAEHFNRVQHQWAIAALIFFLIGVLGVIFFFSTLVAMLSSLT